MIVIYKNGFDFNGVLYGWKDKKLFRLPQQIGLRFYPLKEIKLKTEKRKSGIFRGYLLYGGVRKSVNQLEAMTIYIGKEINKINDSDCPFLTYSIKNRFNVFYTVLCVVLKKIR